jgi:hypothetical protein
MDLTIFKIISGVLSALIILYGWGKLAGKQRVIFALMISFFFLSTVLFFPEGVVNDWFKHLPFVVGQFFFYLLLGSFVKSWQRSPTAPSPTAATALAVPTWFESLTEQGLQHILVLPFFLLIWGVVGIKGSQLNKNRRSHLNIWLLAGFFLTLIHIGEFLVESQGWMPFLDGDPIEVIEFIWYYLAIGTFFLALRKNKKHASPEST